MGANSSNTADHAQAGELFSDLVGDGARTAGRVDETEIQTRCYGAAT